VKKRINPAFKKKHQEEYDLRALHCRDDARCADVRGGRRARRSAGRERGCGPPNEHGRRCNKSVGRTKSQAPDQHEVMSQCFACDSTDHPTGDLKCHRLARKSRAAIQNRAEFSDGNKGALNIWREQLRELQQLSSKEKAHFCMSGDNTDEEDMGLDHEDDYEDEDEEDGFAAAAVKSFKCFCVKCATTRVCDAICSLTPTTSVPPVSNSVCPAMLTFVSILRTNKTVFPQQAFVVSDTNFQLSQAYEAYERALSWETSSESRA